MTYRLPHQIEDGGPAGRQPSQLESGRDTVVIRCPRAIQDDVLAMVGQYRSLESLGQETAGRCLVRRVVSEVCRTGQQIEMDLFP